MTKALTKGGLYYIDGHFYKVAQAGSKRVRLGYINPLSIGTKEEDLRCLHYMNVKPREIVLFCEVKWEDIRSTYHLQRAFYRTSDRYQPFEVQRNVAEAIADRRSLMDLVRWVAHTEGAQGEIGRKSLLKCHLELYDGFKVSDYIKDFMENSHDDE